jgi:hypothetical protein
MLMKLPWWLDWRVYWDDMSLAYRDPEVENCWQTVFALRCTCGTWFGCDDHWFCGACQECLDGTDEDVRRDETSRGDDGLPDDRGEGEGRGEDRTVTTRQEDKIGIGLLPNDAAARRLAVDMALLRASDKRQQERC